MSWFVLEMVLGVGWKALSDALEMFPGVCWKYFLVPKKCFPAGVGNISWCPRNVSWCVGNLFDLKVVLACARWQAGGWWIHSIRLWRKSGGNFEGNFEEIFREIGRKFAAKMWKFWEVAAIKVLLIAHARQMTEGTEAWRSFKRMMVMMMEGDDEDDREDGKELFTLRSLCYEPWRTLNNKNRKTVTFW